ncbi:serine hydroxymethyltransferase [Candidatus Micrarchaeota archaeon]|nr:serine hydroxymethyltransferase [Candidatus Micrarchaeota archaeon]
MYIEKFDPEIAQTIENEKKRQMDGLELIPSENYVSKAVMEAVGSVFTNKYSEGVPHKRYYGGNEFVDTMEDIAVARAKQLFSAEHVNVQPYSGSPANFAVYYALLELGDKVLGMNLSMGGHLTHGHPLNFSGRFYKIIPYGVDKETELIDYDEVRKLALQEKPKMLLAGFSAYPRALDFKAFKEIADEVGAFTFADIAHIAGLCAAGVHENPVPLFDVVSTTTHKTLRGPRGAMIMCKEKFAKQIDKAVFPGLQGGPHDHVNAAKAVAFKEALQPEFKIYARQIIKNAKAMAEELMGLGYKLVSNGTDNHLMLVDVWKMGITGKEAEIALDESGIYCNKNMIPYDTRQPLDPSGIRLGTPAITSRGMKESEMKQIANWVDKVLKNKNDAQIKKKVREEVKAMCQNFIIY